LDLAAKQKLLLDSIDAWLLTRSIIDKPKKAPIPVVQQRQALADSLARYLQALGLERRSKVRTLSDLLQAEADDTPYDIDD
jgi:cytochrome P450